MIINQPIDLMKDQAHLPITQWANEDRPREKMIALGKKQLSNAELIAILLRSGAQGKSAISLAQEILNQHNNRLSELARLEVSTLKKGHKGMGDAKAVALIAAIELGNRMISEASDTKDSYIRNSIDLFHLIAPKIIDLPTEEFWAIFLNVRQKVLGVKRIGLGGITNTAVDLRVIYKEALELNAVYIALAHNHPSGSLTPSKIDKELTKRISEAGSILHISVIDHLIIGMTGNLQQNYFSFADNGLM